MGTFKCSKIEISDTASTGLHGVNKDYGDSTYIFGPKTYEFIKDNGVAVGQTELAMYEQTGQFQYIIIPSNCSGYLIGAQLLIGGVVTLGQIDITFRRTRAATPATITQTDLNLQLTTSDYDDAFIATGTTGFDAAALDKFVPLITTDGSFAPVDKDIKVIMWFYLKGYNNS